MLPLDTDTDALALLRILRKHARPARPSERNHRDYPVLGAATFHQNSKLSMERFVACVQWLQEQGYVGVDYATKKAPYPFSTVSLLAKGRLATDVPIGDRHGGQTARTAPPSFVDPSRLDELRSIRSSRFDLRRLVRLCEELNDGFANESYMAVAALTRAILDHVPPVFEKRNFDGVASQYAWGKSNRDSIRRLAESARSIADSHLHVQIRAEEILPNRTQVDFSSDLDVLLAEIVRILRSPDIT